MWMSYCSKHIECFFLVAVATRMPRKAKVHVVSDDDDDFVNDNVDDEEDDEEDFEDDELVPKKRGKRRSGRPTRRSRRARDSDSDEPVSKPKRRPRAASLKKPKYSEWSHTVIISGRPLVWKTWKCWGF